jgi:hypothetical protein
MKNRYYLAKKPENYFLTYEHFFRISVYVTEKKTHRFVFYNLSKAAA